ncbi:hypothetical protein [Rhodoligotrophos ferricapiens]|uniref:hypothetical protein n=1 Tax=Rhodoligotrophos ferricapiens TaxID=3069264 RepID=UPI00315D1261
MKHRFIAAAMGICLSGLLFGAAQAAPIVSANHVPAVQATDIHQVARKVVKKKVVVKRNGKVKRKTVVYSSKRYGPRYKVRRPGYGYYYGGYYYRTPWWRVPGGPAVVIVP